MNYALEDVYPLKRVHSQTLLAKRHEKGYRSGSLLLNVCLDAARLPFVLAFTDLLDELGAEGG